MDAAADVTADDLRHAARVLEAIANVDLRELERAMTTDGYGNPIVLTDEQLEAWTTYCAAMGRQDYAAGWARELVRAAAAREAS